DIEGDMRKKAEEITVAMVKSIAEERGRNVEWAEKAVKESASLTEKEALEKNVIDLIAPSVTDLLNQLAGRTVKLKDGNEVRLPDLSLLPRKEYEMSVRDEVINVLANPNVIALLWLAATTGISLELYNPGAILPGMIGLIALLLALAVSQIIPISQGGVLLLILGAVLIAAEMFTGTFLLGVGGVVSLIFGSLYLIDVTQAPGLSVSYELIVSVAVLLGGFLLVVVHGAIKARRQQPLTGSEGLVGERAKTVEPISKGGKVFLDGEYWNAMTPEGVIEKGVLVEVVAVHDGLVLEVKKIEDERRD
ncbi:MAG: nodulation protein NfeD, partial [Bdellovibrionales bacterium]|nr:nodulation protein NfeD [Bdellovibrionales bacterium]